MTAIDFTTMRKGSRTDYGRRIDVCPKCGRKGERTDHENPRNGGKWAEFTHKGHVSVIAGLLAVFHVDDHCSVTLVAPQPPAVRS